MKAGSQFIIATHSPILLAYPHATICKLSSDGIEPRAYEDTATFAVMRDFVLRREQMVKRPLDD